MIRLGIYIQIVYYYNRQLLYLFITCTIFTIDDRCIKCIIKFVQIIQLKINCNYLPTILIRIQRYLYRYIGTELYGIYRGYNIDIINVIVISNYITKKKKTKNYIVYCIILQFPNDIVINTLMSTHLQCAGKIYCYLRFELL